MRNTIYGAVAAIIIAVAAYFALWGTSFYTREGGPDGGTPTPSASPSPAAGTTTPSASPIAAKNGMHTVTLKTSQGDIVFETYDADAPKTVQNFITLAGKGFYDGLTFHRVVKGFVIQGGDPNCNPGAGSTGSPLAASGPCGAGGPGYAFADELNPNTESYQAGYKKGVVAMANSGPNTNGSQFFIMLQDTPLPRKYSIFGKVIRGQDVVDKIGAVAVDANDRPVEAVKMISVSVAETK